MVSSPKMATSLFILNLILFVFALGATIRAGRKNARKAHYRWVASTLFLLVGAIFQAERIGHEWEFEEIPKKVHLAVALSALSSFPLVAWSGFRLARGGSRCMHQRLVFLFVSLVLVAVLTALWMLIGGEPIA